MTPTVSQAENWRPEALAELADSWGELAAGLRETAGDLARRDTGIWAGAAADLAWANLRQSQATTTLLASVFAAGSTAARQGSALIAQTRSAVLVLLAAIRRGDFVVSDTGVVLPIDVTPWSAGQAAELTAEVTSALDALGVADAKTAGEITAAFAPAQQSPRPAPPQHTTASTGTALVDDWPSTSQDRIADQIAALSPEQRRDLVRTAPQQVGNTDGVPWAMRVEANRINIAHAITDQNRLLALPEDVKIREAVVHGFTPPGGRVGLDGLGGLDGASLQRVWTLVQSSPPLRAAAIAYHDREASQRIDLYRRLLDPTTDPTGRSSTPVQRQILAFDPARSSLIELHGDLGVAKSVGVLVPGTNTTLLSSDSNVKTARRFVAAGRGDVAMITYLGGRFPQGPDNVTGPLHTVLGLTNATDPRYALDMAPRLVAFSEDVNRTVDGTGRQIPVTYLGHSYGGSILGTAERLGLTADRTVYVEAAGAGVGVGSSDDWHNRNPYVERYSMTAPFDPIEYVQGIPGGPHGADPDEMSGVWQLATGRRLNGLFMSGLSSHSDVLDEPSDAWHNLLAVITGGTPSRR